MNPNQPNDDLTRLLHAVVDDIEPQPGIQAIRARTRSRRMKSPREITRARFLGAFGAAVATAAVIVAVAVVSNNDPSRIDEAPPATAPTDDALATPTPAPTQSSGPPTSAPPPGNVAVAAYYIGPTEKAGLRLFREWHHVAGPTDDGAKIAAAVRESILGNPLDRDYRTYWVGVSDLAASWNGDVISVDLLADDAAALRDGTGLTPEQREISIQQVIFAAQGGLSQGRVPVQFLVNGNHTDSVLGQPAAEPLANDSVLAVNNHVQLDAPNEGDVITEDTLEVTGVATGFEGTVVVRLQHDEGNGIVFEDATIAGTYEDKLFPFSMTIDLSEVAPGRYTMMAFNDDASGGAEGYGPFTDTRAITIE